MSYEDKIRTVVPYTPGEQPTCTGVIKLNTNECPYPPSEKVKKAVREMDWEKLRLYPNVEAEPLVETWREYNGLKKGQVFAGVGSDDVLSMCFLTYFNSDKPVIFPDITYSFYDVWCEVYRIPYEVRPLKDDFTIDPADYIDSGAGGIVIANPNAPTGAALPLTTIEKIVASNPDCIVIVDEAYVDFGAQSAIGLIEKYDNLVVVQTFSKSRALAGLRVGFAMGCEKLIKYLNDVKYSVNSYTMNYPSIAAGCAAIEDDEYFRDIVARIVKTRENTAKRLREMGFSFTDSCTNFLFAKHESADAGYIFEELKKKNIFVRHWNKPRIKDYLRITIGTDEEMDSLINALKELI